MQVLSLGQEDPLEKGMATHCSILAWRIPWTEEPGGVEVAGPLGTPLGLAALCNPMGCSPRGSLIIPTSYV